MSHHLINGGVFLLHCAEKILTDTVPLNGKKDDLLKLSSDALPRGRVDAGFIVSLSAAAAATALHAIVLAAGLFLRLLPQLHSADDDTGEISGTLLPRSEKSVPLPDHSVLLFCLTAVAASPANTATTGAK